MPTRRLIAALLAAATLAAPAGAQSGADEARLRQAQDRFDREYRIFQQELDRYRQARGGVGGNRLRDDDAFRGDGYRTAPDLRDGGTSRYRPLPDEREEAGYDPGRFYRPGTQERVLGPDDRVYAGYDGRYYCRRADGTTGLIVGAGLGGVLGNVIDGGRSRSVGTLLGAAAGALGGRAVEQSRSVRCR